MAERVENRSKIESNYSEAMYGILKVQDTITRPDYLDTESVKPVIDVSFNGWNQAALRFALQAATSVAGIANSRTILFGELGVKSIYAAGVTTLDPLIVIDGMSARPVVVYSSITFDAAGLAAFAGKTLEAKLRYYGTGGTGAPFVCYYQVAIGASLSYRVFLRDFGLAPGELVAMKGAAIGLDWRDFTASAAFPANTTVATHAGAILQATNAPLPR